MFFIILQQIGAGFLVKSIASFDDTLTRIPVISHLTKSREGRIAFSIGTLLALTVILLLAVFFSAALNTIPHTRLITAVLISALAIMVYFDVLATASNKRLEASISKLGSPKRHLLKVMGIGFLVSFVTLIDDAIVLVPLFLGTDLHKFLSVIGVYAAAIVQIAGVIYFGQYLDRIKHKKELASASLVILSILVITGIV